VLRARRNIVANVSKPGGNYKQRASCCNFEPERHRWAAPRHNHTANSPTVTTRSECGVLADVCFGSMAWAMATMSTLAPVTDARCTGCCWVCSPNCPGHFFGLHQGLSHRRRRVYGPPKGGARGAWIHIVVGNFLIYHHDGSAGELAICSYRGLFASLVRGWQRAPESKSTDTPDLTAPAPCSSVAL
jgi:hypothetical protein